MTRYQQPSGRRHTLEHGELGQELEQAVGKIGHEGEAFEQKPTALQRHDRKLSDVFPLVDRALAKARHSERGQPCPWSLITLGPHTKGFAVMVILPPPAAGVCGQRHVDVGLGEIGASAPIHRRAAVRAHQAKLIPDLDAAQGMRLCRATWDKPWFGGWL